MLFAALFAVRGCIGANCPKDCLQQAYLHHTMMLPWAGCSALYGLNRFGQFLPRLFLSCHSQSVNTLRLAQAEREPPRGGEVHRAVPLAGAEPRGQVRGVRGGVLRGAAAVHRARGRRPARAPPVRPQPRLVRAPRQRNASSLSRTPCHSPLHRVLSCSPGKPHCLCPVPACAIFGLLHVRPCRPMQGTTFNPPCASGRRPGMHLRRKGLQGGWEAGTAFCYTTW